ncbi:MAG: Pectate lyase superfamily protein [candidate division BRC1 bacterium ADurb.BinA364]|nr:MAG: Pectate lyase superfamily protein [candidate division BRC1 bacterium ADurb.BinA364]
MIGQTGSAIRQADFCPLMLVGFQIAMDKGPAVSVQTISYGTAPGTMALVDGSIEFASGGRAIDNASAAKTIYLRNIFVKGESELIKSGSQAAVVGSGEWARIAEYAYTDQTTPAGKPPYADGDKKFRTFSMVEGVVSRTPEPVRLIESDASAPPGSLVSRHLWRALPSYEGQADGTVIATSAPYNAKPDDLLDDRAAIQAAIDAASAAGHGRVFLPKGQYQIGGPLVLRANTKLFGVGRDITEIAWHSSWQPTSGIVYMLETENDASADTTLAFLTITMRTQGGGTNAYGAFNYDRFGAIHWRAGRRSIIAAIKIAKEYAGTTMTKTNPRNVVLFTDSAGGKHYSLLQHSPLALGANPDFRVVKIDGTTAPLAFYGLNVECTKNGLTPCDANIELIGAQNVRIYGTKREGDGPTAIVRDSRNVGYFGHGRQVSNTPSGSGGMLQVLGSSENITIAPVIPDSTGSVPNGEPLVREHLSGGSVNEIIYPDCLSIYKRGELDDSMFGPSPDASVTTGKAYM